MLEFLRGKASDRKLRLWACGCCRRAWRWLERHAHKAIEVAERHSDLQATAHELAAARAGVEEQTYLEGGEPVYDPTFWACGESIVEDVRGALFYSATTVAAEVTEDGAGADDRFAGIITREKAAHVHLSHDVFGNPFRPVPADPAWLTSAVVALAGGIYADRAFDRMPILADALEDAGCEDTDVLSHCRSGGPHVRGCWVVDLLLGKE
jgi:hypothetical protein